MVDMKLPISLHTNLNSAVHTFFAMADYETTPAIQLTLSISASIFDSVNQGASSVAAIYWLLAQTVANSGRICHFGALPATINMITIRLPTRVAQDGIPSRVGANEGS